MGSVSGAGSTSRSTAALTPIVSLRPLLKALAPMSLFGIVGGFWARQPTLVALAAPATALVLVALIRRSFSSHPSAAVTLPPAGFDQDDTRTNEFVAPSRLVFPEVGLEFSSPRVAAGEEVDVSVTLLSPMDISRCDVAVTLPVGVEMIDGTAALAMSLKAREPFDFQFRVRTNEPGLATFGPVVVRIDDRSGLFRAEQVCKGPESVKVVPSTEALQSLLRASLTGMHVGEQISRSRGDGFEFADMRAYAAGDSAKRIHWRASARSDEPVILERRPDRNQDVLVVLDAHTNLEHPSRSSSLARSMEACVTIAGAHLGARDRVGFVGLGRVISWVTPGTGHRQKFRILDAVAEVSTTGQDIGRRVSAVPVAARPRRSLVVVVTTLSDHRSTEMIRDLQAHRHDLCVVVVAPFDFVGDRGFGRANSETALKLWQLLHEQERQKLSALGTPLVAWAHDKPVELAVREVMAWRQKLRVGR
jgi:uncharacterized protein (DUF58 family)